MEIIDAKGTRNFLPNEKIIRNYITDTIRSVFELYGFMPIETPILQRYETLASKYSGGEEILKETFKLKDQGNRQLGLRYDFTVPLANFIALNPEMKLPFKCYQMGPVFRDGPIGEGRLREFWQCDVDTIGCEGMGAEAQLLNLAFTVFEKLKIPIIIKVNNRKILDAILETANVTENKDSVMLTLDKYYKIGVSGVKKELQEKKLSNNQIKKIIEIIEIKGNSKEKLAKLKKILKNNEGIQELEKLLPRVYKKIEICLPLVRGLSYYTGTIFEIGLKNSDIGSSIGGGGRYDEMISKLLDSKRGYPAVGLSFGLERIFELLKDKKMESITKVYITNIGIEKKECIEMARKLRKELRKNNINTDSDLSNRSLSRNLDYADKLNIPYVVFIGSKEIKAKKVALRNMKTGKEKLVAIKNIKKYII